MMKGDKEDMEQSSFDMDTFQKRDELVLHRYLVWTKQDNDFILYSQYGSVGEVLENLLKEREIGPVWVLCRTRDDRRDVAVNFDDILHVLEWDE